MLAAMIVATFAVVASPAMAQGRQNFTLVNNTGYTINEVYVSATSTNDWEEDVLGEDTLEDNTSTEIQFPHASDGCLWT
ncbi:MAG: hypothetical protein WDN44_05510 [Sphingomonas sp.]